MSRTVCYLLFNSRSDTVHFCLSYWSWGLSIDQNCCLLVSLTSLSAKINVSPYSCHFIRDHGVSPEMDECSTIPPQKNKAWCKQSILILILAQTNCTAECLRTVVLCTTTTNNKDFGSLDPSKMEFLLPHSPKTVCVLLPFALQSLKCGFHFS